MKTLLLLPGLGAGGAEKFLENFIKYNSNRNIEVVVLSNFISENVNVKYIKFNLKSPFFIINFFKLLIWIKNQETSVIHGWLYIGSFVSFIVSILLNIKSTWYIHHNLQDFKNESFFNKILIRLLSRISYLNSVKKIAFVSNQSLISHANKLNFNKSKSLHLPLFYENNINIANINKSLNKIDDVLRVGNFGRFVEIKNHRFLFSIIKNLKTCYSNVELHLAGTDVDSNNKELVSLLNHFDIYGNTILHGELNSVSSLYNYIDIYILTSFSEAFPMVILESLLHGTYVISSDVGDVKDFVYSNGVVNSEFSEEIYLSQIKNFYCLPLGKKQEIAFKNYNYLIKRYDKKQTNTSLLNFMEIY